jgi:hypothetical protein
MHALPEASFGAQLCVGGSPRAPFGNAASASTREPVLAVDPAEWTAFRSTADGGRALAKRRRKHVTLDAPVSVGSEESPVIRWLMMDGRRIADAKSFLENFAMRLIEAAVDVSRITTGVPVLHPQLSSYSGLWERGDVMYGNIGGDTRLDFTVIGPAVNLTSRIESMCKNLDRSPLLSAEFARLSGIEAEYLGEF